MSRPLLTLLSLLLACGPGSGDTDTPATAATSSTSTSDTTTSTSTSDTTTSTADPTQAPTTGTTELGTTGVATTSTTSTSTSTTSDTTLSDTTDTTTVNTTTSETTTSETTGGDDIQYAAFFWAGGLDHILIHRADFTHDRCTTLHIARPGGGDPSLMITAPEQWFPVNASITDSSDGCLQDMPMGTDIAASGGAGTITWPQDPNKFCPPLIDLDLTLDFPQDLPWVPAQESMSVTALPVENCP